MKDLSIIIPTYKNTKYLTECFNSILNSVKDYDVEVIVGIDGCLETVNFLKSNKFNEKINFYFFHKNQGPYIVKNSLIKLTNSENILFFDSDDIMCEDMINDIIVNIKKHLVVKPIYIDFFDGTKINLKSKKIASEGIFAIKKELILKFNGFEPWICGADTERSLRLLNNGIKFKFINEKILFYRRIHEQGLTSRKDTGGGSDLRRMYNDKIINKNYRGPLSELHTSEFCTLDRINHKKVQEINDLFLDKEKNKKIISEILKSS